MAAQNVMSRRRRVVQRLLVAAAVFGAGAGAVLMLDGDPRRAAAGWGCATFALVLWPAAVTLSDQPEAGTGPKRSQWRRTGIAALVMLLALACMTAFYGGTLRESGQFAKAYGTRVKITPDEKSCYLITSADSARTECGGSWEADGRTVRGTVNSMNGDIDEVYALGDNAYSADFDDRSRFYMLGLVPLWLAIPFPVVLVVWLVIFVRRVRREGATGGSGSAGAGVART